MVVHNLGSQNSIFNHFVHEIRSAAIQKDSMRFRRNLERMGEIFAYEISKQLAYSLSPVTTPLGELEIPLIKNQPVLATVLRAGLPLQTGLRNYFDDAENAFIAAYRKHHKDGSFEVEVEYISSPSLVDKIVILADPMLATGTSLVLSYKALMRHGKPAQTHIVTAIASSEGIEYLKKHLPKDVVLWTGAIDEELTAQAYIVPGLGDAGDLAFGIKE